eukprot:scaffold22_cov93-Cylindrotheca_fusiformis.AAC.4
MVSIASAHEDMLEGKKDISPDITTEDKIDSLIAQALKRMSMKERETAYHELHGVDEATIETSEFLENCLEAVGIEIDTMKLSHHKGLAYNLAEVISSDYVHAPELRLKFLRSERFDARKSADRLIRFFDCKLQLFGPEKLCKDITLDDLDAEDMVRVMFYLMMSTVDDKETQRRGVSFITCNIGKFKLENFDTRTVAQESWLLDCVPIRMCSLHHCYDDPAFRYIVNVRMHFLSEDARARSKLHSGSLLQCTFSLMTYGFPVYSLPLNAAGELKRKGHFELLNIRRFHESRVGYPRIVVPTNRDVLFGRGKPFRQHPGNMKLFEMIDEKLDYYKSVPTKQKTMVIAETVEDVQKNDGRFLRQDWHGCWIEVDVKMAKEKVSHAFRTRQRTRLRIASTTEVAPPCPKFVRYVSIGEHSCDSTGSNKRLKTCPSPTSD